MLSDAQKQFHASGGGLSVTADAQVSDKAGYRTEYPMTTRHWSASNDLVFRQEKYSPWGHGLRLVRKREQSGRSSRFLADRH
jgi:hypothetical protein